MKSSTLLEYRAAYKHYKIKQKPVLFVMTLYLLSDVI